MKKRSASETAIEIISLITIEEFLYLSSEFNIVCDSLELLDQIPEDKKDNVRIETAALLVHFASKYHKILSNISKRYSKSYKNIDIPKSIYDKPFYNIEDYDDDEPVY